MKKKPASKGLHNRSIHSLEQFTVHKAGQCYAVRPNLNQSTQAQTHSCQAQGIENKSLLGERTESYMQRERREHGGQGSAGAHALHTVI